jgi:membrane protease YdiL (CAAX protease family)
MRSSQSSAGQPWEALFITLIFAGWFMVASTQAMLAGFPTPKLTDREALAMVLFEVIAVAIAGAVLYVRGWRLSDIRFRITPSRTIIGLALFAAVCLFHFAAWFVVGHIFGGKDVLLEFALATSLSVPIALLLSVVNGMFEEFFLTRYLIEAFAKLGAAVALGISALVRVLCHLYQGPVGVVSILGFGLILTLFYWRYREIWPVMFAHIAADFAAFS